MVVKEFTASTKAAASGMRVTETLRNRLTGSEIVLAADVDWLMAILAGPTIDGETYEGTIINGGFPDVARTLTSTVTVASGSLTVIVHGVDRDRNPVRQTFRHTVTGTLIGNLVFSEVTKIEYRGTGAHTNLSVGISDALGIVEIDDAADVIMFGSGTQAAGTPVDELNAGAVVHYAYSWVMPSTVPDGVLGYSYTALSTADGRKRIDNAVVRTNFVDTP